MLRSQLQKRIWLLYIRLLAIAILSTAAGCASTSIMKPVPEELISQVGIEGIPEARFWGDEWPKWSLELIETYTDADFQKHFSGVYGAPHNYLAISGGGSNGAFGADSLRAGRRAAPGRNLPW